jgi:peptidyl-dipeptidase A
MQEDKFVHFLNDKEQIFDNTSVQLGTAYWNLYSSEGEVDLETPRSIFFQLFTNDTLNASVDYWSGHHSSSSDNLIDRRVTVWKRILTGAKVDMTDEIYNLEDNLERWLSTEEVEADEPAPEEMEKLVLELMKMRNEKAQSLGYDNYAYMLLELQGLPPDYFYSIIDELDAGTKDDYDKLINEYLKNQEKDDLTYADCRQLFYRYYASSFAQTFSKDSSELILYSTLNDIGIDLNTLPARFVIEDIPFGGNGIAVSIPNDFRAVMEPGSPITFWLHESGHGLQAMYVKTPYPILKGYEWALGNLAPAFAEGLAEFIAEFALQPEWQIKYAKQSDAAIDSLNILFDKHFPVYVRFMLFRSLMEIEFYKNLDKDFTQIRNELIEKYLGCPPPESPVDLLAGGIYASYPVYMQNYLLAEIFAWHLHTELRERFGDNYMFDSRTGEFIINNLYEPGESVDWQEKMRQATGTDLNVNGFINAKGRYRIK